MKWRKNRDTIEPIDGNPMQNGKKKDTVSNQAWNPFNSQFQAVDLSKEDVDSVDSDEEPKIVYETSKLEKLVNYLLCRGDLADKELSVKPVTLLGLVGFWKRVKSKLSNLSFASPNESTLLCSFLVLCFPLSLESLNRVWESLRKFFAT